MNQIRWSLLLATALVATTMAGCGKPEPKIYRFPPLQPQVEALGVKVGLTPADRREYGPRKSIWVHVRIENTLDQAVKWTGGGCNVPAAVSAVILSSGVRVKFEEKSAYESRMQGYVSVCPTDIRNELLAAHGVIERDFVWDRSLPILGQKANGQVMLYATFPLGGMDASKPLTANDGVIVTGD